jgi:hypothetical protein
LLLEIHGQAAISAAAQDAGGLLEIGKKNFGVTSAAKVSHHRRVIHRQTSRNNPGFFGLCCVVGGNLCFQGRQCLKCTMVLGGDLFFQTTQGRVDGQAPAKVPKQLSPKKVTFNLVNPGRGLNASTVRSVGGDAQQAHIPQFNIRSGFPAIPALGGLGPSRRRVTRFRAVIKIGLICCCHGGSPWVG